MVTNLGNIREKRQPKFANFGEYHDIFNRFKGPENGSRIMKQIEVVAAIIHDDAGRIFATQRGYGDYKDGWEFPGGKMEAGETPEEALKREIWEELETRIVVERLVQTVEWDYPKLASGRASSCSEEPKQALLSSRSTVAFHLTMHCFWCHVESGSLTLKEHEAARWLTKEQLDSVDWLPADKFVVEKIRDISDNS
jgi:8-oxo-dGTP diphosphatase